MGCGRRRGIKELPAVFFGGNDHALWPAKRKIPMLALRGWEGLGGA